MYLSQHLHPMCGAFVVGLLHRVPPSSTRFPYTTLFRSALLALALAQPAFAAAVRPAGEQTKIDFRPDGRRDRKSTRLNSSHLGISYAVFCLKKKNLLPYDLTTLAVSSPESLIRLKMV